MSDTKISDPANLAQFESLVKKHTELARRKERTAGELASVTDREEEAKRQAERDFGTSDLAELRSMIIERRESNARKVAAFESELSAILAELNEIDEDSPLPKAP